MQEGEDGEMGVCVWRDGGEDVRGRTGTDLLPHVAEEFGVGKEAGSAEGLKRKQRSRCCP